MKKRNGVVLFVTLMMILLLMSVVSVFLNKTKESKDKVTTIFAMNQTNAIMHNLLSYISEVELDEYAIFFASQTAIPLNFGESNVFFRLESAQKLINLNGLIRASMKDNLVSDTFVLLLLRYKIQEPGFFLNLLKDTVDEDTENRDSTASEIILEYPTFRNTKIYNEIHLSQIVDYYFKETGDMSIYEVPFDTLFTFTDSSIDLNFISLELMEILFDDINQYTLRTIDEYDDIYEDIEDMPFDAYYRKKIQKGMLGQSFTTKTQILNIEITLLYLSQFESKIHFKYNIKSKKIFDYEIDEVLIK